MEHAAAGAATDAPVPLVPQRPEWHLECDDDDDHHHDDADAARARAARTAATRRRQRLAEQADDDDEEALMWALLLLHQMHGSARFLEDEEEHAKRADEERRRAAGDLRPLDAPRRVVPRDFREADRRVHDDWLRPPEHRTSAAGHRQRSFPVHDDEQFARTFRISRRVYEKVKEKLIASSASKAFQQRTDALGKNGISPDVKMLLSLKGLAYGAALNSWTDYFQVGESTALATLREFCKCVVHEFSGLYMRRMTERDVAAVQELHLAKHGLPFLASLDCMHVVWVCPVAWKGQYQGKEGVPTLVLEAMFDYNLRCWHAAFGYPGTLNDISIFELSPLREQLLADEIPWQSVTINGTEYNFPIITVDGIYPELACFWKTISVPIDNDERRMAKKQEQVRKDAERGFGVLQAKFQILTRPLRFFDQEVMADIVNTCVIFHNMMVEERMQEQGDEYDSLTAWAEFFQEEEAAAAAEPAGDPHAAGAAAAAPAAAAEPLAAAAVSLEYRTWLDNMIGLRFTTFQDRDRHDQLQRDITEHFKPTAVARRARAAEAAAAAT